MQKSKNLKKKLDAAVAMATGMDIIHIATVTIIAATTVAIMVIVITAMDITRPLQDTPTETVTETATVVTAVIEY
jgi:hypothetical protein